MRARRRRGARGCVSQFLHRHDGRIGFVQSFELKIADALAEVPGEFLADGLAALEGQVERGGEFVEPLRR